jgi:hypothetical protein
MSNYKCLTSNELGRGQKGETIALFLLSQHLPGVTEDDHESLGIACV